MKYSDYELLYMVKENEEAFEYLALKYEPLFKKLSFSFANKYKNVDIEELEQNCRITLCDVVDKYDYNKEVLFYSYLLLCLKRMLKRYIDKSFKDNNLLYYMDIDNYENIKEFSTDNLYSDYLDYDFQNRIILFKNSLDNVDSCIFELRYNGFTYNDIASLLDLTYKKVDNILVKIRKKMEKDFLFSPSML